MGTTDQQVQGRGPQPSGGGDVAMPAFERHDPSEQTVPTVRVVWTTTRQYEAQVPASLWEKLGGRLGATGDGPVDQYLTDLETSREYSDVVVLYRDVDDTEPVT